MTPGAFQNDAFQHAGFQVVVDVTLVTAPVTLVLAVPAPHLVVAPLPNPTAIPVVSLSSGVEAIAVTVEAVGEE